MRGSHFISLICILCLSLLVHAQVGPAAEKPPGSPLLGKHAAAPLESRTLSDSTPSQTATSQISSKLSGSASKAAATRSSIETRTGSASSTDSTITPTPTGARTVDLNTTTVLSSTALATGSSQSVDPLITATAEPSTNTLTSQNKTLVIVLSSVLGSIGIILVALVLFLVCRYRKRRAFRRGVSPINDDEIESWRNSERKTSIPSGERGIKQYEAGTISLAEPTDWVSSPSSVQAPQPVRATRSASFLAKAPNARAGLTDEAVPGAEPFLPAVKRQSSRLSKAPRGHARTKSRRSSASARSVQSNPRTSFGNDEFRTREQTVPDWFDAEARTIGSYMFSPTVGTGSSPGTSIYDGVHEAGGLSPRPKPKPWDPKPRANHESIGRAIS